MAVLNQAKTDAHQLSLLRALNNTDPTWLAEYVDRAATWRLQALVGMWLDAAPVIGDYRAFKDAQTASDYAWATVGLIPLAGDAARATAKAARGAKSGTRNVIYETSSNHARTDVDLLRSQKKNCCFSGKPEDFFEGAYYSKKVRGQLKLGDYHSFPEGVLAHADKGRLNIFTGGDGAVYQKLEIPGSYRGRKGIFEFIKDSSGEINHRPFISDK